MKTDFDKSIFIMFILGGFVAITLGVHFLTHVPLPTTPEDLERATRFTAERYGLSLIVIQIGLSLLWSAFAIAHSPEGEFSENVILSLFMTFIFAVFAFVLVSVTLESLYLYVAILSIVTLWLTVYSIVKLVRIAKVSLEQNQEKDKRSSQTGIFISATDGELIDISELSVEEKRRIADLVSNIRKG